MSLTQVQTNIYKSLWSLFPCIDWPIRSHRGSYNSHRYKCNIGLQLERYMLLDVWWKLWLSRGGRKNYECTKMYSKSVIVYISKISIYRCRHTGSRRLLTVFGSLFCVSKPLAKGFSTKHLMFNINTTLWYVHKQIDQWWRFLTSMSTREYSPWTWGD